MEDRLCRTRLPNKINLKKKILVSLTDEKWDALVRSGMGERKTVRKPNMIECFLSFVIAIENMMQFFGQQRVYFISSQLVFCLPIID